jgi:hypothetical protein
MYGLSRWPHRRMVIRLDTQGTRNPVIPSPMSADRPPNTSASRDELLQRERRAGRVADIRGLAVRRTGARVERDQDCRYDLIFERYNRPVATELTLTAIEVWLGIAEIPQRKDR